MNFEHKGQNYLVFIKEKRSKKDETQYPDALLSSKNVDIRKILNISQLLQNAKKHQISVKLHNFHTCAKKLQKLNKSMQRKSLSFSIRVKRFTVKSISRKVIDIPVH